VTSGELNRGDSPCGVLICNAMYHKLYSRWAD